MRPFALRSEDPPDDAVVVVRGGEMNSEHVRRTASQSHEELGIYGVSVFLALDDDLIGLCRGEPMLARYGKIRCSTTGRLRAAGFALLPTLERPHYDVVLPDLSVPTLDRLHRAFDAPVPNPAREDQE
jgi:hypothetical protein